MKKLRWPVTSEANQYMAMRKAQNLEQCKKSKAESWMLDKLSRTRHKWSRQSRWGYRLFDFWCHEIGIAVEVDGPEHVKSYDEYRDAYNFKRSGIRVIRVPNFDEEAAERAMLQIESSMTWNERRSSLGLKLITYEKEL